MDEEVKSILVDKIRAELLALRLLLVACFAPPIICFVITYDKFGFAPITFIASFLFWFFALIVMATYQDSWQRRWIQVLATGYWWILWRPQFVKSNGFIMTEDIDQLPVRTYLRVRSDIVMVKNKKVAVQLRLTVE